jgi:hypothetical protein
MGARKPAGRLEIALWRSPSAVTDVTQFLVFEILLYPSAAIFPFDEPGDAWPGKHKAVRLRTVSSDQASLTPYTSLLEDAKQ